MCPGAWAMSVSGPAFRAAICEVTPQAQNTGTSPGRSPPSSPKSGRERSAIPSAAGSPACTGAPCASGNRPLTATASSTRSAGIGRMETTSGPRNGPAGSHSRFVTYMGTTRPSS